MKKTKDKQEIEKLKKELDLMTKDRDSSIEMYRHFLKIAQERLKAYSIIFPLVRKVDLVESLAELSDARDELEEIKRNRLRNIGK